MSIWKENIAQMSRFMADDMKETMTIPMAEELLSRWFAVYAAKGVHPVVVEDALIGELCELPISWIPLETWAQLIQDARMQAEACLHVGDQNSLAHQWLNSGKARQRTATSIKANNVDRD